MKNRPISIVVSSFQDTFQSVHGSQISVTDFLPAVEAAMSAGLRHFEVTGRFQSLNFLDGENPFHEMNRFRDFVGDLATLQSTACCINVVGVESQPSDIIKLHSALMKKYGIHVVRNIDALNDAENFVFSGECLHAEGIKHEVTILMMSLQDYCRQASGLVAHEPDHYMNILKRMLDAEVPFDSVVFVDVFGTSRLNVIHETIKSARRILPSEQTIVFQSNSSTGPSTLRYLAAVEGGADRLTLSLGSVVGGASTPDISSIWHALKEKQYSLEVDIDKLREAEDAFTDCAGKYLSQLKNNGDDSGVLHNRNATVKGDEYVPYVMDFLDRYDNFLRALVDVVECAGFATSVIPVSQYYFKQALNNVRFGPWEKLDLDYGRLVLKHFGTPPVDPHPSVTAIAMHQLGMRPAKIHPMARNDLDPSKGIKAAVQILEAQGLPISDENILIVSAFKESGLKLLEDSS